MTIKFSKTTAVFKDVVGIDEAETLLDWLQKKMSTKVDLTSCTHLHPANLQVLLAGHAKIVAWPESELLRNWLEPVLKP
jgi:hypothetical protein